MASQFTHHGPCEACGSSDGVGWYSDGHGVCFVCSTYYSPTKATYKERDKLASEHSAANAQKREITPLTNVFRGIPKRGLPESAIAKYGIDVCMDKDVDVAHRYPYFKDGRHVANKVRKRTEKAFYWEGEPKDAELFGQHLFPPSSAQGITIVEGELDAPSAWTLLGSRYPVVSVASAGSAVADVKANYEYLDSFPDIVVCFDKDEAKKRKDGTVFYPGQEAAKKVAELFAPGKCRIMTLSQGKDPSEYLQNKIDPKIFVKEWWKAPKFSPDGLILGSDDSLWDSIINSPTPFTVPFPSERLNAMTYGLRLGEMVTFTADPKIGKTTILKWIEYSLLQNPVLIEKGYGVGFMHLEEPKKDLAVGLMGLHIGKRLGLPDTETTEDELRKAYDDVINTSRVVIWDHFGSNSVDAVVSKVRHMHALGCKYIILDHFSILASDQSGDERKQLDEIATKLKTLTIELDICLIGVIHQNRQGQIRGTMAFEQLSNMIIRLERDKLDPDPWRRNVTTITVTENRFSGSTGPCEWLFFDAGTGTVFPLDDAAITKFEEGVTINDSDLPF